MAPQTTITLDFLSALVTTLLSTFVIAFCAGHRLDLSAGRADNSFGSVAAHPAADCPVSRCKLAQGAGFGGVMDGI